MKKIIFLYFIFISLFQPLTVNAGDLFVVLTRQSDGAPIREAFVKLYRPDGTREINQTDGNGNTHFGAVEFAIFHIEVLYRGVNIHSGPIYAGPILGNPPAGDFTYRMVIDDSGLPSHHEWLNDVTEGMAILYERFRTQLESYSSGGGSGSGTTTGSTTGGTTTGGTTTPTLAKNAAFVSQLLPTSMIAGQQYSVVVSMKNNGTNSWTSTGGFKLGSQSPQDNGIWGMGRVELNPGETIASGQIKTFTLNIKAPSTPGTYAFQWRMLQEGVSWFGDSSQLVNVNVQKDTHSANFVSHSVPTKMIVGKTYPVSVTMQNSGTDSWTKTNNFKLGSQAPQDNLTWGMGRVELGANESIAPGQTKTFTWNVTAPAVPGNYNFQWRMLQESVKWFGNYSPTVSVAVEPPPDITSLAEEVVLTTEIACRATGKSDRFVMYAEGTTQTCAQVCASVKCGASATCVKGWTTFPGNTALFEYGNECSTAATSPQWMQGKVCCCTGTACAQEPKRKN